MAAIPFGIAALLILYGQGLLARVATWTPDLAPILAAYAGLFLRRDAVPVCAAILGILRGALDHDPIGVLILIHVALGFFASVVRDVVFVDRLSTQLVISFACATLYVAMRWIGDALLPTAAAADGSVFRWTVACVLATLVSPFLFAALRTARVGPFDDR